jgi:SAM-dependent methyltransferase
MHTLDDNFWSSRYEQQQTGWDLQKVSPPLQAYIDQLKSKDLRILIPGCGKAYEGDYLLLHGFANITLIDISEVLTRKLRQHFAGSPVQVVHGNFFEHKGTYDLILEQTFFCALDPALRTAYVQHMHALLAPGGKLVGVLFDRAFEGGPPFGGSRKEYEGLFTPYFSIKTLEPCYNSIAPRAGSEVFIIAQKSMG